MKQSVNERLGRLCKIKPRIEVCYNLLMLITGKQFIYDEIFPDFSSRDNLPIFLRILRMSYLKNKTLEELYSTGDIVEYCTEELEKGLEKKEMTIIEERDRELLIKLISGANWVY